MYEVTKLPYINIQILCFKEKEKQFQYTTVIYRTQYLTGSGVIVSLDVTNHDCDVIDVVGLLRDNHGSPHAEASGHLARVVVVGTLLGELVQVYTCKKRITVVNNSKRNVDILI